MVENRKRRGPETPGNRAIIEFVNMLVKGIEPPAYALRVRCSTPELHQPEAWDTRHKQKHYTTFGENRQVPFILPPALLLLQLPFDRLQLATARGRLVTAVIDFE